MLHPYLVFTLLFVLAFSPALDAQSEMEATIIRLDSLFWQAYNDCDTETMASMLDPDLEFYHDKGGLTMGREALIASMRNGLCATGVNTLERRAVQGSVAVFPIRDYGAYEQGTHTFHLKKDGAFTGEVEQAYFSHLWQAKPEGYVMTRVFSYDHHMINAEAASAVALDADQLHLYTGTYLMPDEGVITVTLEEGRLQLSNNGKTFVLTPVSEREFVTPDRPLSFVFSSASGRGPFILSVTDRGQVVAEARQSE
ncbi:DUF4440 domain-containing protein [Lewinella sp. IMCC34191]|uniref:nuclear transport factor 2 family protein n=1 Tax=Lewinella sp. IMCC34191 TaxID=2259172 RepID=UPI000E26DBD7|nr:DUF4440 domain-containing protein [Lewinella sp. IMCC34191]